MKKKKRHQKENDARLRKLETLKSIQASLTNIEEAEDEV
jgi:hypothetical protein